MKKLSLVSFLMLLLVSCSEPAVDTFGNIAGTVTDAYTLLPLAGVSVKISPLGHSQVTGNDGAFQFDNLEVQEYTIAFSKPGYQPHEEKVSIKPGLSSSLQVAMVSLAPFTLSVESYDFGDLESEKEFSCFNNSDQDCSYEIKNIPDWISANKTRGNVRRGSSDSFVLTADRSMLSIGQYNANITVSYTGKTSGNVNLNLTIKKVELSAPTVENYGEPSNIQQTSFDVDAVITATGGSLITAYGHCWSTHPNPTISDRCTNLGSKSSTGQYRSSITDLTYNTEYHVRAYAQNAYGISYGEEVTVLTQDVSKNVWDGTIAKSFAGGSGSKSDPYIIETGGQLLLMKDYYGKSFKLANNIDLNNNNWLPFEFKGTLDGNGYTIFNLKIQRSSDRQGLFSYLGVESVLKNLTISNVNIIAPSNSYIGAFAGTISGNMSEITNCHLILTDQSEIQGNDYVGGIVGSCSSIGTIVGCTVDYSGEKPVIKGNSYVGGIIGYMSVNSTPNINSCKVSANIQGVTGVGGIAGYL